MNTITLSVRTVHILLWFVAAVWVLGCEQKQDTVTVQTSPLSIATSGGMSFTASCVADGGEWPARIVTGIDGESSVLCVMSDYWVNAWVPPHSVFSKVEDFVSR